MSKKLTQKQWKAAVDLLQGELSNCLTLLAQIVNDPSNEKLTTVSAARQHGLSSMILNVVSKRTKDA